MIKYELNISGLELLKGHLNLTNGQKIILAKKTNIILYI